MENINELTAHTVAQWEAAIKDNKAIAFEGMSLHRGFVCGVTGIIRANSKQYNVKWLWDGRCLHNGKRVRQYDIQF